MKRKRLLSSEDAVDSKGVQHEKPCSDCPWARASLPGWLGSLGADEWLRIAHRDDLVDCHALKGAQCAGIAIYRRNVAKARYPPNITLPADRENVFAWPAEFKAHHEGPKAPRKEEAVTKRDKTEKPKAATRGTIKYQFREAAKRFYKEVDAIPCEPQEYIEAMEEVSSDVESMIAGAKDDARDDEGDGDADEKNDED